jgi:(E)-4-hydroxy-3-methylbut-2-enyl-diphosphate synthase
MGCEVNGPGEAADADVGIAAGKGSGVLFKQGEVLRRVREEDFVRTLFDEVSRWQSEQAGKY